MSREMDDILIKLEVRGCCSGDLEDAKRDILARLIKRLPERVEGLGLLSQVRNTVITSVEKMLNEEFGEK